MTREEAIKELKEYESTFDLEYPSYFDKAILYAIKALEQEPKIGHWIWDSKNNIYRCSCCNHFPWRINTEKNDEVFIDMKRTNAYKFCPNCGAKMVEPQESENKE